MAGYAPMIELDEPDRHLLVLALTMSVEMIAKLPQHDKPLADLHRMTALQERLADGELELAHARAAARRRIAILRGTNKAST